MGGRGSGEWMRHNAKLTVEDGLTLSISDFRKRLHPQATGRFVWTCRGVKEGAVDYSVARDNGDWIVTLHYRRHRIDVRLPIRLQLTPTQFGGERLWFTCPLVIDGVPCERRSGKLHLPPGARYFGCRLCHDLTYRSCQEAHQLERCFGRMGYGPIFGGLLAASVRRMR